VITMHADIPGIGPCDIFIRGPELPNMDNPHIWTGSIILPDGEQLVVGADTEADLMGRLADEVHRLRKPE